MPVQRWRLIYARGPNAPDLPQREQQTVWTDALLAAGLPGEGSAAPKFVPAAPIALGLTADAELADFFLSERRTSVDVRERLLAVMPVGMTLVGLHDVWLGEPALPGLVVAGDYRVTLVRADDGPIGAEALLPAIRELLAATSIARPRGRPDRTSAGDLRPLIHDVQLRDDGRLWLRLRFDPALGTGRPEEVVSALGGILGQPLATIKKHRERLWLRGEELD
jgi:radical SAM-linked protein